jgi:dihydrolipoamide dehydrogenase
VRHNVTKEVVSFDVAKALICIGRDPNYSQLALSNIGVELDHGKLRVDKWGRCAPHNHIYAVGDATVDIALVNKGESEGICAINHMFSVQPEEVTSIDNLSTIMFLDEEVAGVGLSELQCRKRNIAYCVANYGYNFVSRAVAMGNPNGFVKIIVTNDARKTVLGVRAVGAHASSVVELASLAIHRKASAYDLSEMAVAYPAVTQGFQECIRLLLGRSILKADVFPALTMSSWTPPDFGRGALYQKEAAATRVEAAKRKYKATGSD